MLAPGRARRYTENMKQVPVYREAVEVSALPGLFIRPLESSLLEKAQAHLDNLTKPRGSLGRLEELGRRLYAMAGGVTPLSVSPALMLTVAGDHGVTAQGVSPMPQAVTRQMTRNFLNGGAGVNVLCRSSGMDLRVVDAGCAGGPYEPHELLIDRRLGDGTADISKGPAMSRETCLQGLRHGIALVEEFADKGYRCFGTGEMGIGNSTPATAINCALFGFDPDEATGPGAGSDPERVRHKAAIVRRALEVNAAALKGDGVDILAALGGFELAIMAGIMLGAASRSLPILVDGFICSAAYAAAVRICPLVAQYAILSHASAEPGPGRAGQRHAPAAPGHAAGRGHRRRRGLSFAALRREHLQRDGHLCRGAGGRRPVMETGNRDDLLTLEDVRCHFPVRQGMLGEVRHLRAVDGVDLVLRPGQSLGLVGESGCGKSTLGRLVCGLQRPTGGRILFRGAPLPPAGAGSMAAGRIQMVFQDPFSSLDPRCTVGTSVEESLLAGERLSRRERRERVRDMFATVGLAGLERRYPHEFSGGQRQRIAVARALMTHPDLIVCDEPVSALDASVQAQILNLLRQVQEDFGPAYLFISHDLAVVGFMCPHILVMYLGRFVEEGPRERLLREPAHPYTRALLASVPSFEDLRDGKSPVRAPQQNIRGELPSPLDPPSGCRFHPRCPQATERCREEAPQWKELEPGWRVRCHLYG